MLLLGPLAGIAALIALASPAAAQSGGQTAAGAGWYIGAGAGANWLSTLGQEGWNRENYCYPDAALLRSGPDSGRLRIPLAL